MFINELGPDLKAEQTVGVLFLLFDGEYLFCLNVSDLHAAQSHDGANTALLYFPSAVRAVASVPPKQTQISLCFQMVYNLNDESCFLISTVKGQLKILK